MEEFEMDENSIRSIVEIVREYRHQYEQDASKADRTRLERGRAVLYDELQKSSWNQEIVHSSHELLDRLGDKQGIVDLMNRYLLQLPPTQEEAWARWHLTDNLAMLRRCEEAVETHKDYLAWTRRILPCPDWWLSPDWPWDFDHAWRQSRKNTPVDECLLFRIMYDGTQARCWIEIGKSDEWLQIFHELMCEVASTPCNRVDRRYYLRTATSVLSLSQRPHDAIQMAKKLDELSQEDSNWEEAFEIQIDARCMEVEAYSFLDDVPAIRQIAHSVTDLLEKQFQALPKLTSAEIKVLRSLYHNFAAPLYRVEQYDLAMPLFRRAIELRIPSEYSYLWLAASIWATKRDRAEVLSLLKTGVFYSRFGQYSLSKAPEFKDVASDPEFAEAMKRP
jgi:tetratricopeptide (TPR) repeat protein